MWCCWLSASSRTTSKFSCSRVLVVKQAHFLFSHFASSRAGSNSLTVVSNLNLCPSNSLFPSICTNAPFIFFPTLSLFVAVGGGVESTVVHTGDRSQQYHWPPTTDCAQLTAFHCASRLGFRLGFDLILGVVLGWFCHFSKLEGSHQNHSTKTRPKPAGWVLGGF